MLLSLGATLIDRIELGLVAESEKCIMISSGQDPKISHTGGNQPGSLSNVQNPL